jgi:hypothetical protein
MKHIKLYEQFVLESKEEKEAKAILQDLLDEHDPWDLMDMLPGDALDTVAAYGHKGASAKKIADILQNLASKGIFEAKFKTGDKWEWHTSDGVKTVEITNIKPNGDVVGREAGTSEDFIVRDANKYLKKKVTESTITEAKTLTRDEMMATMRNKYGLSFVKTTEEFDGEEGGIWLGGSDGKLMPNAKDDMFNYYHGGAKYPQGVHKDLAKFLDKCGWYGQFADPGTVMLWPR